MDEKTVRWPGHAEQIRTLMECGLLETEPMVYHGEAVVPRELVSDLLSPRLVLGDERDLTLLRVDVSGRENGRPTHHRYEMVDHYDRKNKTTSMARTTAFPCSIAAQILASGRIPRLGLVPPELAFRAELRTKLFDYLKDRAIHIKIRRS